MHIKKYRYEYGQSSTCLIHSMKIFALTFQSTLLVTLRAIYHQRKNSNKQSHHKDKTQDQQNNHKGFSNKTKALKCKGVDVLEGDRWKWPRESQLIEIHQ